MKPDDFKLLVFVIYLILFTSGLYLIIQYKKDKISEIVFFDAFSALAIITGLVTFFGMVYFGTL